MENEKWNFGGMENEECCVGRILEEFFTTAEAKETTYKP